MSEHEVELTSEERDILLDPCVCGHTLNDHGDLGGCWICNETNDRECWVRCEDMFAERAARIIAARLADAEARVGAAEAAIDRVRKRHPRGDEEAGPLAPGLWCPSCGQERKDNGYGGCPDREALRGDQ